MKSRSTRYRDLSDPETIPVQGIETIPTQGMQSMSGAILSGLKWKVITSAVAEGARIVVAVVLARLLVPADYGVAGMAFIFAGFVTLFSDLALGGALVQRREINEAHRSTVFWTALGISLAAMGVAIGTSGLVADFFHEPEVRKLVIALSFSFPLAALTTTQVALLNRRLAYRSLELRTIAGVLCGAVVAIVMAVLGLGPWAIVANSLTSTAVSTALLWKLSTWRPRAVYSIESLRAVGGFGVKLFGVRLLNYANGNADNMLVGRFAGASALGIYSLAYNVMFTPMNRITTPIASVVYPALARMQDDLTRLRAAWLRSKRLIIALLAPAFLMIAVTAPDSVHVVFGAKWSAAVPVLQLLCLAGVANAVVALNWSVLQATGRVGTELRLNLFASFVTIGAFALGVRWGALGVAGFYAGARWLLIVVNTRITTRAMSFDFTETLLAGCGTLPLAIISGAAAFGVRVELVQVGIPALVRLFAVAAIGIGAYLLLLVVAAPTLVAEARHLLLRRRDGSERGSPASAVVAEL
jgi:O-antigen/teichoic acid export membrane protein